jgi:hypothetical protein
MGVFIGKILVLVALPSALIVAIAPQRAVESTRFISPHRYQLWHAIGMKDRIRALAFGDSHAAMGFRSSDPAAYSLAFVGENVSEIVLKARVSVPVLSNARTIFLQAQPHMFYPHRGGGARAEYVEWLGSAQSVDPRPFTVLLDPCCRGGIPGVALREFFHIPVAPPIPDVDADGFLRYPTSLRITKSFESDARREVLTYAETFANRDLQERFAQLVSELVRGHRRVVLTRYPLSPEYLRELGAGPLTEADRFFSQTAEHLGAAQCGAWDAITDHRLFFNADHLSPQGASLYWHDTLSRCADEAIGPISKETT